MKLNWLNISNQDLATEYEQLTDEGRDLSSLANQFQELLATDLSQNLSAYTCAENLFDEAQALPLHADYPYEEPSDLEAIRTLRPTATQIYPSNLTEEAIQDRLLAAWLGRCAGNLLGKPVESWLSPRLTGFLKETDNFPLQRYLSSDISPGILERYQITGPNCFINKITHAPEDDDLNYTVTGLAILKQYGHTFTPEQVAEFWLLNIPLLRTYTAERVAYRNLAQQIPPPESAAYRNPYREWIGAQIRADFWGYANLGYPERAAEYAWRDACLSHIKNGIYGEMWVAAMLAVAPFVESFHEVIRGGLAEIPANCRLAQDIQEVIAWKAEGIVYDQAIERIHQRWDEKNPHHWCHTNSNAQIVVIGLLWGEEDFGKSICRAVQPGFDTDCNGATVGSIFGMRYGTCAIPKEWTSPLQDTLETGITGYRMVRISDLAKESFEIYQQIRGY